MESYYVNQAGNGIPLQTFSGYRFQKGYGIFGRLFASKVLPILRYLGQIGLETGKGILDDVRDSTKNRVRESIKKAVASIAGPQQEGQGILGHEKTYKRKHSRRAKGSHSVKKQVYSF